MKLLLTNVGLIKKAEIDYSSNLIVLTGPNNTGKTYAAYVLYGLSKLVYDNLYEIKSLKSIVEISSSYIEKIKEIQNNGVVSFDFEQLSRFALSALNKYLEEYSSQILAKIFNASDIDFPDSLIEIQISNNKDFSKQALMTEFETRVGLPAKAKFKFIKQKNEKNLIVSLEQAPDLNSNEPSPWSFIDILLLPLLDLSLSNFLDRGAFIATAERGAINLFAKEVSLTRNDRIDSLLSLSDEHLRKKQNDYKQKKLFADLQAQSSRYSIPIRDNVRFAEDLLEIKKSKSSYAEIAESIEKRVLHGSVSVSDDGSVVYQPASRKKIPEQYGIHLTSSAIKSLVSLVIYFRHKAKKGSWVIIDEPELNLHPDNQRLVAKILAFIANQGFKVIISTHSEFIIREFNNMIRLKTIQNESKKLPEELNKEFKADFDSALDHEKLAVYLFNKKVEKLNVNKAGFSVKSIDDAINRLNEQTDLLDSYIDD
jgi:predicted ATP-dependent endonuclease of OLD family